MTRALFQDPDDRRHSASPPPRGERTGPGGHKPTRSGPEPGPRPATFAAPGGGRGQARDATAAHRRPLASLPPVPAAVHGSGVNFRLAPIANPLNSLTPKSVPPSDASPITKALLP